jgi:hypothetical protein
MKIVTHRTYEYSIKDFRASLSILEDVVLFKIPVVIDNLRETIHIGSFEDTLALFKELLEIPVKEEVTGIVIRVDKFVNVETYKEEDHEGE